MATEIAYKVSVDTGEGGKSLKTLKSDFKQAQQELDGLTVGTKAYTDQLKKLGAIKDEIGDLNDTIKAFNPEGKVKAFTSVIGGLASGFQAAQGAAALFGGESKEVEKALLKVQAVMAFTEGIKGIIALEDGFKNLWLIIKSNPLGAILSGLTALAATATVLYTNFNMTSQATKDLTAELEKQKDITEVLSRAGKRQIDLLTAQGGSEREIIEVKKQMMQAQILEIETSLKLHERKLQDIRDNDSIWESTLRVAASIQSKLGNEQMAENILKAIQLNKQERAKEDLEAIAKEKEDLLDLQNNIKVLSIEKINLDKKQTEEYIAELKKRSDARKAQLDYNAQIDAEIEAAKLEDEAAKKEKEAADEEAANLLKVEQNNQKIAQADADWALEQQRSADRIALNKAEFEATMQTAQASTNAMASLANFLFDLKASHLQKGSAAELKAAKRRFQVNKALAISSNIISTIMGITNALSAQSVIPDPFGTILKVATAAAVGISGTVATAKIASQKFEGGGSGAGGGGGGVPSIAMPSPPSVSPPQNESTSLNPDGTVKSNKKETPTVIAKVVETDVTSSQKRVDRIETSARL